ncbi:MAG: energy-dependent translational throttle protein EttA, partial [Proteobacteria bacterium]|nr:energy-dependent translational throttle protein EttA [Pseudomonadota bacterium]
MAKFIYTLKGVTKIHPPDRKILNEVYLSFLPGAKIGVLGLNGAGKSSLLRIMAGVDSDHTGEAFLADGSSVGFLPQEPDLGDLPDVHTALEQAVRFKRTLLQRFEQLSLKLGESLDEAQMQRVIEEHGRVQDAIESSDAWNLEHALELAGDALRLPPSNARIATLSGGEKRRVALCQVLLRQPDLLLLDEPTNHLDAESVAWLEQHLAQYAGCIVAVTHDRYFLDNVAQWILELDRGEAFPFKGNYSAWLEHKQARLASEDRQGSARRRKLARELEWVRSAPKARQAKGRARLTAYEALRAEEDRAKREPGEIFMAPGERLGDRVIDAEGLTKAFGERLLFEDLSFRVPKGAIVAVIGANGTGKTTLCRLLVGAEEPDAGRLRIGDTVKLAYVDQTRDKLDGEHTVWQHISGGEDTIALGKHNVASRAYVSWFGFRGSDQQKLLKNLSGGERNRVHLAKLLKRGANVLLLDEPTNDLDVETLRSLEEALLRFSGCAIVVSHDRWF